MESYKHSCPVCGQHIEYTAGYCGRQMQCPMCGNAIVFPAVPPSRGGKPVSFEPPRPPRKWAWNPGAIIAYLRDYPHWTTVWHIAVPFLIIGGLLAGAAYVKNTFSDQPAAAAAPTVQAPAGGWDKMTEFAKADQKVQQDIQLCIQAHQGLASAQRALDVEQKSYSQSHSSDEQQAIQLYVQSAQRTLAAAQNTERIRHQQFDADIAIYQKLGGTIDYRSRVPNY